MLSYLSIQPSYSGSIFCSDRAVACHDSLTYRCQLHLRCISPFSASALVDDRKRAQAWGGGGYVSLMSNFNRELEAGITFLVTSMDEQEKLMKRDRIIGLRAVEGGYGRRDLGYCSADAISSLFSLFAY